jgi:hypothetical protein
MQSQSRNQVGDNIVRGLSESAPIERIFGNVKRELEKLSKRDARDVLKAICGIHDLKVSSAFAPTGPTQRAPLSRDTRGEVKPRMKPLASPRIKAMRSKIRDLNRLISKKSSDIGGPLPVEDPLIVTRAECFRLLKEEQNTRVETLKEGSQPSR